MHVEETPSFRSFKDMEVYQVAREFRKRMYRVSHRLPGIEKFALADQIRRAAVSLTNNIAEGHGRYHYLDQLKFLLQARGSLEELQDDLTVCADESYLPDDELNELTELASSVHRLINGYGRYLRQRKSGEQAQLKESPVPYADLEASDPFGPPR